APGLAELGTSAERLREICACRTANVKALAVDARSQLDALAGQLRTVVDLAVSTLPDGHEVFERREARQPWPLRLSGTIATLRANLNLRSAAFRHGVRLAICVALGSSMAHAFGWHRPYWAPMTIAIVLKPDFTATFSRGVLRLGGTVIGLLVATGLFQL